MKLNVKNEQGFTLVELMVVVAIIGVLSAVAIPNFKKYQAKAKTSEAKVQLASAFTAEQSFYGDFGMYSSCLAYMGYDPSKEVTSRYFAVGINIAAAINTTAHATAVASGLNATDCPSNNPVAQGNGVFIAGKGSGSAVINTVALIGTAMGTAVTSCTETTADTIAVPCIGTQAATASQSFNIGAAGVISGDAATAATSSFWTMSSNKRLRNIRTGY